MPRKSQGQPSGSKKSAAATKSSATAKRRSKLAKENDISAEQEAQIKEAWALFRLDDVENYEDETEGVIRTEDVRRALKAQGLGPRSAQQLAEFIDILDPESDGYVTYPHFLELCALQLHNKSEDAADEEVEAAFKLFTKDVNRPIRLDDLRRIATLLKENLSDDVLKAMILEANNGMGLSKGVGVDDFRSVLTRAGVFQQ